MRFVPPALALLLVACGPEPADRPAAAPAAPAEGTLTGAEGAELFYQVVGSGPDTVFVVHGGPGAGIPSVRPPFEPLAEDHTLVFYAQRGGGRSTLPADTSLLAAEYHIADLDSVRSHFGVERMTLLTHSFGAILAARYAIEHPERVERIVFHGATGPSRAEAAKLARRAMPDAETTSPDSARRARMAAAIGSLLAGTAEDPVAACREYEWLGREMAEARGERVTWTGTTCDAPPEAVAYYYRYTAQLSPRSFGDWDFTCPMGEVEAPLLVIHSARDSLKRTQQEAWARAVPHGRILVVAGSGKSAATDAPERVLEAISMFVDGSWPEAARTVEGPPAGCPEPRG